MTQPTTPAGQTPTPRTDKEAHNGFVGGMALVPSAFARTLETELTASRAEVERLTTERDERAALTFFGDSCFRLIEERFKHEQKDDETPFECIVRAFAERFEYRADLARLRLAQEWQGIESAPRDGTEVLLFALVAHGEKYILPGHYDEMWRWVCYTPPTHWRPIPPPPAALDSAMTAKEGGG